MQRKKTFYVPVTAAGTLVSDEQDIPKEVGKVVGITISGDREDQVYARASVEVNIAGTDIVKQGERATQYMFGVDNPQRLWPFGEISLRNEDRKIKVRIQDKNTPLLAFSAYTVEVIITYVVEN